MLPTTCCLATALLTYRYGGMFYAIVDAASVGLQLEPSRGREICRLGKYASKRQQP